MRIGRFPGQDEMLKDALAFSRELGERRATRRALLVAALGLPVVVSGTYFIGKAAGVADSKHRGLDAPQDDQVALATRLALASDGELLAGAHSFLFVLARQPDHLVLWAGFGRLVELALARDDTRLLDRLRQTARVRSAPGFLSRLLARLNARK